MTPSVRDMTVVLAVWQDVERAWRVFLPGKLELLAKDEAEVGRFVAAFASGSAVKFVRIAPQHN